MFAMIYATRDEKISSLYEKVNSHRTDAKIIKNLLVNLQNKLTMMDSHIEISFESIKTKIN